MTRTLLSSRSVMRLTFSKPTLARTPPGVFSLAYELRPGPKGAEPMILIQGLGMQLTDWPPMFLDAFATRYHLILVDNRDSGLSAQFGPTFEFNADKRACDLFGPAPELARYNMFDMAADVVSTMNKLAVPAAHFLGFSMGGMIAQIIASDHPARVLSLVSLMSSGGEPWLDCSDSVRRALIRSMTGFESESAAIANAVDGARLYSVKARSASDHDLAAHFQASFTRCYSPGGILRQAIAMRSSGDRRHILRQIGAPTFVLHGREDHCISAERAIAAAKLIPNARLSLLDNVGHDPNDLDPQVLDDIVLGRFRRPTALSRG